MERAATLERRLANFRAATRARPLDTPWQRAATADLAERMAVAVDGEVVRTPLGSVVRREPPIRILPIDRERLARLPGQPPADAPLVCLDTETTGLATAAGTVAFLVGLGWWEGDGFRQVQLLLPDHAEEPALLALIAERIPPAAWLVTYNGRGFDWPLLVTRFRMARRDAPPHAGHLDLLPLVRRLFRHRMADARLRTAEAELLGLRRVGDVDGWQIPGRYLDFLRGGPADPLVEVVRHNDQDVRSLAHLVGHVERGYADPEARSARTARRPRRPRPGVRSRASVRRGARMPRRGRRGRGRADRRARRRRAPIPFPVAARETAADWWQPAYRPDFGGRPRRPEPLPAYDRPAAFAAPWSEERLYLDRAHVLRRLGRIEDAGAAWAALAASPGRLGVVAAIELSKLREHRLRDPLGAFEAATRGLVAAERTAAARAAGAGPRGEPRTAARYACGSVSRDGREWAQLSVRPPAPAASSSRGFRHALSDGLAVRHARQPGSLHEERRRRSRQQQVVALGDPPADQVRPRPGREDRCQEHVARSRRIHHRIGPQRRVPIQATRAIRADLRCESAHGAARHQERGTRTQPGADLVDPRCRVRSPCR